MLYIDFMGKLNDLRDLTDTQRKALEVVESEPRLFEIFYLTGGTLLKGLGVVPRESNDLDFFTFAHVDGRLFMERAGVLRNLLENSFGRRSILSTDRGFVHKPSGMLVETVQDGLSNIAPFALFGRLRTASLEDVAAHKASALCSRDEIKDYIDVAFLTRLKGWTLQGSGKTGRKEIQSGHY